MKTLFITHHYLSTPGGGAFASRAYINAFAELSEHMTLLYPVKEGQNLFEGLKAGTDLCPVAYDKSKVLKLIHLLKGKVHRYFDTAPALILSGKFDTVVFDTSLVSYRLIALAKRKGLKTIVIHHNYQYEYFRDNVSGPLKYPTLFWCRRYEAEAVANADLNLTLTPDDARLLCEAYGHRGDNFRVLGTFESLPSVLPGTKARNSYGLRRFTITGSLADPQTERSLIPWIGEFYPVLKSIFPEAELTVAGRNPSPELRFACEKAGIRLIPSPVSMDPIMEESDCYICPTSLGGGLKLRVMDGLRWGLPVLAHKKSARGYEHFIEHGCMLQYDDLDSFRKALEKLSRLKLAKKDICGLYDEIFSFRAGVERLDEILRNSAIKL